MKMTENNSLSKEEDSSASKNTSLFVVEEAYLYFAGEFSV